MESSGTTWADEASARFGDMADQLNDRFKNASANLHDIDEQARTFIKESPFVALAAAVAGGFLLGRLLSRL